MLRVCMPTNVLAQDSNSGTSAAAEPWSQQQQQQQQQQAQVRDVSEQGCENRCGVHTNIHSGRKAFVETL